jgi:hypothetical protein
VASPTPQQYNTQPHSSPRLFNMAQSSQEFGFQPWLHLSTFVDLDGMF